MECGEVLLPFGGQGFADVDPAPGLLGDVPFAEVDCEVGGDALEPEELPFAVDPDAPLCVPGIVPHGEPLGEVPGVVVLGFAVDGEVLGLVVFGVPLGELVLGVADDPVVV
jgi:hypothetical protein